MTATLAERSGRDSWTTTGVHVELFESGQTMIKGVVEDTDGGDRVQRRAPPEQLLRRGAPVAARASRRGSMATGAVGRRGRGARDAASPRSRAASTRSRRRAAELEEQRYDSPEAAVAAFAKYVDDLVELALSRDPTTAAWQSDVDEYGRSRPTRTADEFDVGILDSDSSI